jgi:hypothetical protein
VPIATVRLARGDAADGRLQREPQSRRERRPSEATVDRDPGVAESVRVAVAGRILPAQFTVLDRRFGVEAFGCRGGDRYNRRGSRGSPCPVP